MRDAQEESVKRSETRRDLPLLCPGIYIRPATKASTHVAATTTQRRVSKERARRKKREKSEKLVEDYDRFEITSRDISRRYDGPATNKIETFVAIV